ncbi:MAG: 4-diphosphocytidyl-2-C-methyl-D-erythritol kinase [Rhodospirillaceae bacterium]|nr:MAG: 4-diphosphocytidyl-2-C-methyl-D-erythritol kinase [Rhodospirillaceae bacterium]
MKRDRTVLNMHPSPLREFAPAKVNLYLHVVGRREDGYHRLDSLVAFAGVGDTVTVAPAAGLSLRLGGPFAPLLADAPDNIVLRAARLLAERIGMAPDVAITLDKRLPVAAGLGGGSADAAATLRGLIRLWNVDRSADDLIVLALALGADVPVCLYGAPAQVSGIGEGIEPAPALPSVWLLLVNPLCPLATATVFKVRAERGATYTIAMPITESPGDASTLASVLAVRCNDLQESALALESVIGTVLEVLARLPGCLLVRMSGSGTTCFGLFADGAAARAGARALAIDRPTWWSAAAPLLPPF